MKCVPITLQAKPSHSILLPLKFIFMLEVTAASCVAAHVRLRHVFADVKHDCTSLHGLASWLWSVCLPGYLFVAPEAQDQRSLVCRLR